MGLTWQVARRSFRRWSTYRAATVAGVVTNTVFGYLRAYVLVAVAVAGGGTVGGWDEPTLVTFSFMTQALLTGTGAFGETELAERVRSGDVVVDLYRPIDLQAWWLASWTGRAGFAFLARGIPPALVGAVAFDLVMPTGPVMWLAFVVSVTLASGVGFALRFLTNLSAFWLLDNRGVDQLVTMVLLFFSGMLVPIVLFPAWLETAARALPFAGMIQLPTEVFMGRYDTVGAIAGVLALQAAWLLALLAAGRLVLAAATRKVVVQGG